jgi:hypothetical protein
VLWAFGLPRVAWVSGHVPKRSLVGVPPGGRWGPFHLRVPPGVLKLRMAAG